MSDIPDAQGNHQHQTSTLMDLLSSLQFHYLAHACSGVYHVSPANSHTSIPLCHVALLTMSVPNLEYGQQVPMHLFLFAMMPLSLSVIPSNCPVLPSHDRHIECALSLSRTSNQFYLFHSKYFSNFFFKYLPMVVLSQMVIFK